MSEGRPTDRVYWDQQAADPMTLVSNGVYQGPRAAGLTALAISPAPFAAVIRHHKSGSGSGLGLARVRFRLRVERVRICRVRVRVGDQWHA